MIATIGFLIFAAVFCYYMNKWSLELAETERLEVIERTTNAVRRTTNAVRRPNNVGVGNFGAQVEERRVA